VQVKPLAPPQDPSVETLPGAAEVDGAGALVDVGAAEPQVPKPDWQPVPQ
jgi:hypothetical protein